jgi:ABC-2 type transport system permease protein
MAKTSAVSWRNSRRMLGLLLHNRVRALINSIKRGGKTSRRRIFGYIGLIILPLLVMINMYALMAVMAKAPQLGLTAIHLLLRNMLFGIFLMLLFSGLALVLHIFFLSKDLPLLMSSPIALSTIFQFKLIETTVGNSTLFFGIALPVLISAGVVIGAPLAFWLLLLPLSLLFLTIPTGLSAFLAMGLVSIMPPRRAKNVSAVLLSFISIGIWMGFQLLRPENIRPGATAMPGQRYMETGARISTWLPSDWLANSLMQFSQHHYIAAAGSIALLIAAGLLLYGATSTLLKRALRRDIFSGVEITVHKHRTARQPAAARYKKQGNLFWIITRRDSKIILRDTQQLTQLLLFTVMMILLPFINRSTSNANAGSFSVYMPYLFLFIFSSLIGSSIATRMVPMERTAFGLLKLAPIRLRVVWLAKMAVSYCLTLVSGLIAAAIVALIHHTPAAAILRIVVLLASVNIGTTALGGLFGALFPNFEWDHPKRMLHSGGGIIMSIVMLFYIGIVSCIIALSFFLFKSMDPGIIASALIALIALFLGTVLAEKKLDKIEWLY